jgi:hypothetical protein
MKDFVCPYNHISNKELVTTMIFCIGIGVLSTLLILGYIK